MQKRCFWFALCLGLLVSPFMGCSNSDDNANEQQEGQVDDKTNPDDKALKINAVRSQKAHEEAKVDENAMKAFVKGQYDLNFELLKNSKDLIDNQNAMISTFSIQSALGMTWAGAAGDTAAEMKSALHFDDNTHQNLNYINAHVLAGRLDAVKTEYEDYDAVDVAINNDIYVSPNYTWKAAWLDTLSINYDAGLTEMNFAADPEGARQYINDIVSTDTHERIKDLLPPNIIDEHTQFVLTNAIYFKAPWGFIFYKQSSPKAFNMLDNSTVDAVYISAEESMLYAKGSDYQAVSVPLRGNHFAMMFIVPDKDTYSNVESSLNGEFMNKVFDELKATQVRLSVPEFSFETSLDLVNPFKALGMSKAFTSAADFSGMTEEPNSLYIAAILHKSFIGIDENGVEAAAATAVVGKNTSEPDEPTKLDIDRPFVFMVYEKGTNSPLFVGRLLDPSKK